MTPTDEQIESAPEHVAWEYVSLLAAAKQMARGPLPPINHQVQEAFLVHVRNLAEFFYLGVDQFKKGALRPPRGQDNIYAVDLCSSVSWSEAPFHKDTKLRRAINKTLSHMTYSRDLSLSPGTSSEIDTPFDGQYHAHGTVKLKRRTWDEFMKSMRPQHQPELKKWLLKHAGGMCVHLDTFDSEFEALVKNWPQWKLNQTPDSPV